MSFGHDALTSPAAPHPLSALLRLGRPVVMGIVNVTPDSFSDGGRFLDPDAANRQAERLVSQGADILDIGGESTRPYGNAVPVSAEDEWARIAPVLAPALRLNALVSVDTMKSVVAEKALRAGARIINDVWGLQRDPEMARVVAQHDAAVVIMHNRAAADASIDIFPDIEDFFARSLELAERAGVARDRIVLDPGIGFGKTPEQSLAVVARLDRLRTFGYPLLIGLSRKRFIAAVSPSQAHERLGGSIAANLHAVAAGADIVRVHDVAETVQALRIAAALKPARNGAP